MKIKVIKKNFTSGSIKVVLKKIIVTYLMTTLSIPMSQLDRIGL